LLLAFAATVIVGSGPHGTHDHIFLSPNWVVKLTVHRLRVTDWQFTAN
jgi:hypothetical protein